MRHFWCIGKSFASADVISYCLLLIANCCGMCQDILTLETIWFTSHLFTNLLPLDWSLVYPVKWRKPCTASLYHWLELTVSIFSGRMHKTNWAVLQKKFCITFLKASSELKVLVMCCIYLYKLSRWSLINHDDHRILFWCLCDYVVILDWGRLCRTSVRETNSLLPDICFCIVEWTIGWKSTNQHKQFAFSCCFCIFSGISNIWNCLHSACWHIWLKG